jgi:hypothetical protein
MAFVVTAVRTSPTQTNVSAIACRKIRSQRKKKDRKKSRDKNKERGTELKKNRNR